MYTYMHIPQRYDLKGSTLFRLARDHLIRDMYVSIYICVCVCIYIYIYIYIYVYIYAYTTEI